MERQMQAVLLIGKLTAEAAPGVDWDVEMVKESGKEVRFVPQAAHVGVGPDGRGTWRQPTDTDGFLCPTITVTDGEVTVEHHPCDDGDESWYHERAWMERFQYYGYCR